MPYIPKRRTTVRVCLPAEEPIDGLFFTAFESSAGGEPETLLGVLNSTRRVVPFVMHEDARVRLLVRRSIDWVLAGPEVDPNLIGTEPGAVTDEQIELTFMDQRTTGGRLIRPRVGEARVSDYLNQPQDFIALNTRMGTLLVNKLRVTALHLLEARARMPDTAEHDGRRAT